MARYADEGAVAQSAQSYYHLPVPNGLPWTGEIIDLIDELAAERLPDHLTAKKRAERAEQREQEAEREALRQSITERIARGSELDTEELSQLREEIQRAHGHYTPQAHELYEQLDELERQASDPADAGAMPPPRRCQRRSSRQRGGGPRKIAPPAGHPLHRAASCSCRSLTR